MVDHIITLFESDETDFLTNGIGTLTDAISCVVTEKRNDEFELEMEYPITGKKYEEIKFRRIILAKPNPYSRPQPFRIYLISKPMNGRVIINASHISYDLSGYSASPFSASNVVEALSRIKSSSVTECPFDFWTDKTTVANISTEVPYSIRSILGGIEGSIVDTYRGEYEFDRFLVKLYNNRGTNRGVSIRYGKNLTDLKQEENCNNVYTAVYPFWYSEEDGLIDLEDKLINVEGTYNYTRILTLDLSEEWQEAPTEEQLRSKTLSYINTHNIGIPEISLTVSFVQLSDSSEYRNYSLLEEVHLCDTVNIEFPKLGVNATAKCITTTFNVLTGKYDSIELGNSRASLATTISDQNKVLKETVNKTALEQAILTATDLITGHSGGYVVLNPKNHPSEILILDTPNLEEAHSVWRWNGGGLGYSSNGYNGPYELAITMDGAINADFISAGTIDGSLLRAGSVESLAISQYYKNEVTNEIGEATQSVEQAFVAADEQLASIISNIQSIMEGDITTINQNISHLQQTIDGLTLSSMTLTTGGINKIRNSSGLNGVSDDWSYTGSVVALQNSVAETNTTSGSMFSIRAGTLSQEISVIKDKTYTLTFKAYKATNNRCYVLINNGGNEVYILNDQYEGTSFDEYSYTFTASGDSIILEAGTTGYYFYVADFMLVEGDNKSNWTPAPNEIYTKNVKIDRRGISITNSESSTETIIDNTQFAVKHNDEVVLTVNKDLTTLHKTEVLDELTIGKGKFIPVDNGLNFILLD